MHNMYINPKLWGDIMNWKHMKQGRIEYSSWGAGRRFGFGFGVEGRGGGRNGPSTECYNITKS